MAEAGAGGGHAHEVGHHWKWTLTSEPTNLGPINLQTVHADTLVATWLVMGFLIVLALWLAGTVSRMPTRKQSAIEALVEFIEDLVKNVIGPTAMRYFAYIGSLFFFIWTANWFGMLPWRALSYFLHVPELSAPTADLNTTAALALMTLTLYWVAGSMKQGFFGYVAHHFTEPPLPAKSVLGFIATLPLRLLFTVLNLMEHITRPLSLAMRLFGNISAEHIVGAVLLLLAPWLLPLPLMALGLMVGVVQAFVFAFLTTAYIGLAVAEHGDHHEHEGAH